MTSAYDTNRLKRDDFYKQKGLEDKLCFLAKYALFAPSRNNTKPWKVEAKDNKIFLYADLSKRLDIADPYNREMYISLGCAIANIEIVAEFYDLHYFAYNFTEKEINNLVTIFTFSQDNEPIKTFPVSLFHYIPLRHTNRSQYAQTEVGDDEIHYLGSTISYLDQLSLYITDKYEIKDYLADLTEYAEREQFNNLSFRKEQAKWISKDPQSEGIPLSAFHLSPLSSLFFSIQPTYNIGPDKATFDASIIRKSPLIAILMSENDEKSDWISTGVGFQTLALQSTAMGLSYQPMTSMLEVPYIRRKVQDLIESTQIPQMFFRLGYTKDYPYASTQPINKTARPHVYRFYNRDSMQA
jgi:hypothetical protein